MDQRVHHRQNTLTGLHSRLIIPSVGARHAAPLCFVLLLLGGSCTNRMEDISRFDRKDPPMQTVKDAHVWRSEQGRLQMELVAPYIVKYRDPDIRTHYPKGVDLRFYDADRQPRTTIRADKATSFDDRDILYAKDNVVVVDYSSGDTIYLEDITWRSGEDRIFSNRPVRAVNGSRVTYGDGFVSDANLSNLRVTRQRGTIEFVE